MRRIGARIVAVALALAIAIALQSCGDEAVTSGGRGDVDRGREAIERYSCGSCHRIPGVDDADARTAPPLDDFSARAYIAGVLVNDEDNLARWVRSPQEVKPGSAMPDVGVTDEDARDIAAYLQGLR
jgi:cytochrome c2